MPAALREPGDAERDPDSSRRSGRPDVGQLGVRQLTGALPLAGDKSSSRQHAKWLTRYISEKQPSVETIAVTACTLLEASERGHSPLPSRKANHLNCREKARYVNVKSTLARAGIAGQKKYTGPEAGGGVC